MLDPILALFLAFIAGLIVKSVDWIDDERKGRYIIKWPLAIIYGGLIGLLISQASFSTIFLAALFAQVFAQKIDTHTHVLGFAFAILSLIYLGFPSLDIYFFGFFIVLAFMDEIKFFENPKNTRNVASMSSGRPNRQHASDIAMSYFGRMHWIMEYRPFLKLGALLMLAFGRIDYFLGIMLFDIGYIVADISLNRFFKVK